MIVNLKSLIKCSTYTFKIFKTDTKSYKNEFKYGIWKEWSIENNILRYSKDRKIAIKSV